MTETEASPEHDDAHHPAAGYARPIRHALERRAQVAARGLAAFAYGSGPRVLAPIARRALPVRRVPHHERAELVRALRGRVPGSSVRPRRPLGTGGSAGFASDLMAVQIVPGIAAMVRKLVPITSGHGARAAA
jgi:hypothetical protein